MRYFLIVVLFLNGCANSELENEGVVYKYVDFDGSYLWLENMNSETNRRLCSGHTCFSFSDTPLVCDDEEFYCIDYPGIAFSIPKNFDRKLPKFLGKDDKAITWIHNGMKHDVWPWSIGRALPDDTYIQTAEIWGSSRDIVSIRAYAGNSERPYTTILYSIEYGVLGIQGTVSNASNEAVNESYLLVGTCGYLAKSKRCK